VRAAVIGRQGEVPAFGEFREPEAADGSALIDVDTAGLGGWDILGMYRLGVEYPCVLRGEGVGRLRDGRRVYFGERSAPPFGAWADRTCVPLEEVWEVPDDIDDALAITMAIAGTGALAPLEQAAIQPGESVLILGATGALGQIALQLARIMGAGRVVAAARSGPALNRLLDRGIADAAVRMGGDDDVAALKQEAGEGFDVVLDLVCGQPLLSALKATRWGARIKTIGVGAGDNLSFNIRDLLFRSLALVGTGQRSPEDRRAIWHRLLDLAREHRISVDYLEYPLTKVGDAWTAQAASPHAKVIGRIKD
jgi:NADPH:quinone reductase-like Zn-dependent oxidoreductase